MAEANNETEISYLEKWKGRASQWLRGCGSEEAAELLTAAAIFGDERYWDAGQADPICDWDCVLSAHAYVERTLLAQPKMAKEIRLAFQRTKNSDDQLVKLEVRWCEMDPVISELERRRVQDAGAALQRASGGAQSRAPMKAQDFARLAAMRFHACARVLRERRADRPPLIMEDEYDVQYLLHSMLELLFADVRKEEFSPSWAGSNSRIDFLLPDVSIAIEVKFARAGCDSKLRTDLIEDIFQYQKHPDVDALVCLVYDPEGCLKHPIQLRDLASQDTAFRVDVVVVPPTSEAGSALG